MPTKNETNSVSIEPKVRKGVAAYLVTTAAVLVLMMAFGVVMLLAQGNSVKLSPSVFYELMTAHGTGMIGLAALGGAAMMWYFASRHLQLNPKVLTLNFTLFILGVVAILVGIFVFDFADAWTFLYPLPAASTKFFGKSGALFFLLGLLTIGVGFLIFYFEIGRKVIKQYGSLRNGLGWDAIFGSGKEYGPPAAVVASTMVVICNSTAILAGAVVLVASILNILNPAIVMDPLLAKHLTYAFGHVFANCTIYMAVIGVYELLSKYTNRPWKANKVFLIAWNFSTMFTLMIYTHHLLMDFAVPKWMLIIGQVFSYANGLPVMVVTAYGALMIVYKSGIKWDMPSGLMFMSMLGWVAGAIPAIIDATIVVNHVMHNTKWVPGHFHTYMGMGVIFMIVGFMYYFVREHGPQKPSEIDRIALATYFFFFSGLVGSFLYAGKISVPRRWAVHYPEWIVTDKVGALCGIMVVAATLVFFVRFVSSLKQSCK